jgi:hypothetical protein
MSHKAKNILIALLVLSLLGSQALVIALSNTNDRLCKLSLELMRETDIILAEVQDILNEEKKRYE